MTVKEMVLGKASDWMTVSEIAEGTGFTRKHISSVCHSLLDEGKVETGFFDGRGTVYRAVPGAVAYAVYDQRGEIFAVLGNGEMTVRGIAEITGRRPDLIRSALAKAEKRGLTERVPDSWPILWRKKR